MPVFADSNSLYAVLRDTFTRLVRESPDHLSGLKTLIDAKMVLQLKTKTPPGEITLNSRGKGFQAIYGPTTIKPDLVIDLSADTLHRVLLDEMSIKSAWAAGKIKVKGPVWKLKVLTDLIKGAREYYPQVLEEHRTTGQPQRKKK